MQGIKIDRIGEWLEKNRELQSTILEAISKYQQEVGFMPDVAIFRHKDGAIGTDYYEVTVKAVIGE